ncbi:unnamed protein product [Lactuca saligna]|uniref:Uncharacterized protein n=1 Tax=Lactuca saligna TaxID=75948 RepID=A0AA36EJ77_LACSI|nr:unnamed protein product [Lactuca saligna]
MVDLYGRLSRLDESLRFIQSMSCAPIAEAWGALLNPNTIYKNVEMAKLASRKMEELEANNEGAYVELSVYVELSNVFADFKNLNGVDVVRHKMKSKAVVTN